MPTRRLNVHHTFVLVGGEKWYAVVDGEVVSPRPVELAEANSTAPCVHCWRNSGNYCRSCRRAVCQKDFEVHCGDHESRHRAWTTTDRIM
jgi:hypothetical protein